MKKTSMLFGAVILASSTVAIAQSPTGGTEAGVGAGMTKSQANQNTLGNPKAMGNGPGIPNPAPAMPSPAPVITPAPTPVPASVSPAPAAPLPKHRHHHKHHVPVYHHPVHHHVSSPAPGAIMPVPAVTAPTAAGAPHRCHVRMELPILVPALRLARINNRQRIGGR